MKKLYGIVSLSLILLLACRSENPSMEISNTAKANFKLLPAESNMILYCDFSKIQNSPFASNILEEINAHIREQADEDFEAFREATGLDPQKDFHDILIGSVLAEERGNQKAYAIIHGEFDEQRIVAYIREQAEKKEHRIPWEEENIAGKTVYVSTESRSDASVCFVNSNTLYVGPRDWMEKVLSGKLSESLNDKPDYVNSLVKNIKYGDQLWMALDAKMVTDRSGSFASELKRNMPAFERVQSVVFSAKANSDLDFNGMLLCDSKESGEVMVDLMKGALAAAKLAVSNERAKVDELNKIKIYQDGNVAVLQGELTDEFFKTLKEHRFYKWNRL